MKKLLLSGAFCSALLISYGQQNTVATGGDATGTGGSMSFTVGQIDYMNASGTDGTYNQGVQQPFEFFEEAGLEEESMINATIYPNPTQEHVILELEHIDEGMHFKMFDVRGRLIHSSPVTQKETLIEMKQFESGEYHLSLSRENTIIKSIKIIKH